MTINSKHGGDVYEFARSLNVDVSSILDFSASINPLGPPESVTREQAALLFAVQNYPDITTSELLDSISQTYKTPPGTILAGNGSMEFLLLLPLALGAKNIMSISPSFSEYGSIPVRLGITEHKLTIKPPFKISPEDVTRFITSTKADIDLLYLCNPNNPTGSLLKKEEILKILAAIKNGYLVLDEAFIDFCPQFSLIWENHPKLIIMRSFTKFFAMPGLRLGFIKADKNVINAVRGLQPPWSVNAIAMRAGIMAMGANGFIEKSIKFIKEETAFLFEQLRDIKGLHPYQPSANFILVRLNSSMSVTAIAKELKKDLILIRDCTNFGIANHFRVAVKKHADNVLFLEKITDVIRLQQEKQN